MRLKAAMKALLGLAYPRRCPFCNQVLGMQIHCTDCAAELKQLRLAVPRLPESEHYFKHLAGAACVYRYKGCVRDALLRFKREDSAHYAQDFSTHMLQGIFGCTFRYKHGIILCENLSNFNQFDLIVPVPPSNPKQRYSAPLWLAKGIGQGLGIPLAPHLLTKVRITEKQEGKPQAQRLRNLKKAYAVTSPEEIDGRRILLVDDVITTGATVSECAATLEQAGALQVFAVAFAETQLEHETI